MKNLVSRFKSAFTPLQQLLLFGLFLRLFSVIFSKGFGWHDDHFLIIESSQSWVDGYHNYWLPTEAEPNREPQGHALFYIGLHYYIFKLFTLIGFTDPQLKMMVIRLLHALWSLLIIKYAYKIAETYGGKKAAWYAGIFMTFYWFMPFMSVRNLVEFVCVPPILIAVYLLIKPQVAFKHFIYAGLLLGLAFSIRFQVIFIMAGVGLALVILKAGIKNIIGISTSFLVVVLVTQGLVDFIIWKRPFAEFISYVEYNLNNASTYGTDNWHMYFDLILGLLIPPLSLLLFAGFFYSWKKTMLMFIPVLIYLLFHTYFPNKQERFIMTILPLIIITGTVGMFMMYKRYESRISLSLLRICKTFVIVINLILLPVLTVSYSKRHRVEAMTYLYRQNDSNSFMIEDSNKETEFLLPPLFYYGKWTPVCGITKQFTADSALAYYNKLNLNEKPGYIIFWQAENINARVDTIKKRFPSISLETTIEPSFIDKTLYTLNPLNDNHTAFIYRIN
jgi:hypothetical protein